MCPISEIRPGAMIGFAVVALRFTKPIRLDKDSHNLFPSSIVPPFSLNRVRSVATTIPFAIAIMFQLITAPDCRMLTIILITFSSISSGRSFGRPLFCLGIAMKSALGLSACCRFSDFTKPRTVDSEISYFFLPSDVVHEQLHILRPHNGTRHRAFSYEGLKPFKNYFCLLILKYS